LRSRDEACDPEMKLAIVVAAARDGVIGRAGGLPWRLPKDSRHFKRLTMGHCIIMGRRTYESIGRPLPGRTSIVVTRDRAYTAEGALTVHDFDEALRRARELGDDRAFVVGGADLYRLALPRAELLYLTRVHADVEGDTRFPDFDSSDWKLVAEERHEADERHAHPFTIQTWERKPRGR